MAPVVSTDRAKTNPAQRKSHLFGHPHDTPNFNPLKYGEIWLNTLSGGPSFQFIFTQTYPFSPMGLDSIKCRRLPVKKLSVFLYFHLFFTRAPQQSQNTFRLSQACHSSPMVEKKTLNAQRGARTHDPEIKSLMLYRLS